MAAAPPLYRAQLERDACGLALLVDLDNRPSRELVDLALGALARLAHRGGGGDTSVPPDGAGILVRIPWSLLSPDLPRAPGECLAAGMLFFPRGAAPDLAPLVEAGLLAYGWEAIAWRPVPAVREVLHPRVAPSAPDIFQVFARPRAAAAPAGDAGVRERALYRARRLIEHRLAGASADAALISLSTTTVVYKGLVAPADLPRFYPDLREARFTSSLAIVHERFSTNTAPCWRLAQPFRVLAHNGEINTILGNRLWMTARQADPTVVPGFATGEPPLVRTTGSDSESLDDAVELLRQAGYSLPHALARLVPPAWEQDAEASPEERAFHRFQACLSEPWDGPAALAFSDGRVAGAMLDRNGFRPLRVARTADRRLLVASEAGVFDVGDAEVVERGRLGPGEMLVADLETGALLRPPDVRRSLARARPYAAWLARAVVRLDEPADPPAVHDESAGAPLHVRQRIFGCSREELDLVLRPMAEDEAEPVGSMGDDAPPAALSERPRLVSDYARQRFAQVTNPPMDPLRERSVMSLEMLLGRRGNILDEAAWAGRLVAVPSPVLTEPQLAAIRGRRDVPAVTIPMLFPASDGEAGLERALDAIVAAARDAIAEGAIVVVLSDREVSRDLVPVPALLATGAVHHALVDAGVRLRAGLIVETGEARDAHQTAALLAFGAEAVLPYLGYASAASLAPHARAAAEWVARYRRALEAGLLKIFSKMGVSTASGYCGGALFELLGLDPRVTARCFPQAICHPGGTRFEDLAAAQLARHRQAWSGGGAELDYPGLHVYRRGGEYRANNPAVVRLLHRAAAGSSAEAYAAFSELVRRRPPTALRDLLDFAPATPCPIEDVEPVEAICRRFFGSAMSVGALSPEAHRTIAVALNRLGARSNSGEGGEEPERFARRAGEPWANSATKQVASARFGVTPAYLVAAEELQIKIAQGSKPGEGGQLPAIKVVPHIARLRHVEPGVPLISPPPHHDIYSIEDLAQLIYDLRALNPRARIGVKLVAQAGVGIVAAGVAKAGADAIQISGHDGGTGASPRLSIRHAGLPWELGLAEAHQVLRHNGLRDRVVLQVDGGLKTGHDIVKAAALGAEEFGFGTALLVAVGCAMARQCHSNTCPVGIATQREDLRARFRGTPEMVEAYLRFVAEEVRALLAALGVRRLEDLVGRGDVLVRRPGERRGVDLSGLLVRAPLEGRPTGRSAHPAHAARVFDDQWLADVEPALGRRPVVIRARVTPADRAIGARIAGLITARFGDAGLDDSRAVRLELTGSAGQSFGAFAVAGLHLVLTGEANDGVAKGMRGGLVAIRPPGVSSASPVLAGNAVLYGATGGRVFIAGAAGERFAVRNSGAAAVVEGVGDHGCEYMTAGLVVVIGAIGRNFGAGMTGGAAYVTGDPDEVASRLNPADARALPLAPDDERRLRALLEAHQALTRSARAAQVLAAWSDARRAFSKVVPAAAALRAHGVPAACAG